jgi:holliday junction resolvase Hjr
MSHKSKGINAERDLVHKFNGAGWVCIRVAGSGSSKYPSPDLLAGNNLRRLAIEAKSTKGDSKYLDNKEVEELIYFARTFGAEPWIALKFDHESWLFMNIEDMKKPEKGYSISLREAKLKGLSFEEVIRS